MSDYNLTINFGDGNIDLSNRLLKDVRINYRLGNLGKHAISDMSFSICPASDITSLMLSGNKKATVVLKKDNVVIFTGHLRANLSIQARNNELQELKLEALSEEQKLKTVYVGNNFGVKLQHFVCNPNNHSLSLLHLLLNKAQMQYTPLPLINAVINCYNPDPKNSIYDEVEKLLYSYGYGYTMSPTGVLSVYNYRNPIETRTLQDAHIYDSLKFDEKDVQIDGLTATFPTLGISDNAILWSLGEGRTLQPEQSIPNIDELITYSPPSDNQELLYCDNLEIVKYPTTQALLDQYKLRLVQNKLDFEGAYISLVNNTASEQLTLGDLKIKGRAFVSTESEATVGNPSNNTIDLPYCADENNAKDSTAVWFSVNKYGNLKATFSTEQVLNVGDIIRVNSTLTNVAVSLRVTAISWTPSENDYQITAEGVGEAISVNEVEVIKRSVDTNLRTESVIVDYSQDFEDISNSLTELENSMGNFATTSYVDGQLGNKADATSLSNYATKSELQDKADKATTATKDDIADFATHSDVTTATSGLASTNYVNSKVDNIQFIGQNLWRNTSNKWKTDRVNQYSGTIGRQTLAESHLKVGDQVTLSMIIKPSTSTKRLRARISFERFENDPDKSADMSRTICEPNTTETYCVVTATVPPWAICFYICLDDNASSNTETINESYRCLKLEKGNVATAWTLAPEDIAERVEDLQDDGNMFSSEWLSSYKGVKIFPYGFAALKGAADTYCYLKLKEGLCLKESETYRLSMDIEGAHQLSSQRAIALWGNATMPFFIQNGHVSQTIVPNIVSSALPNYNPTLDGYTALKFGTGPNTSYSDNRLEGKELTFKNIKITKYVPQFTGINIWNGSIYALEGGVSINGATCTVASTSSGSGTNTGFYLGITEILPQGSVIRVSFDVENLPNGSEWIYGVLDANWTRIHINKNGRVSAVCNVRVGRNNVAFSQRETLTPVVLGVKFSNFMIEKELPDAISSIETHYATTQTLSQPSVDSSLWQTSVPTVAVGHYLWKRTKVTYVNRNPNVEYSYEVTREGKGIIGVERKYLLTTNSAIPQASAFSSNTLLVPNSTERYLWKLETTTFTDNTTEPIVTLCGTYGKDGSIGVISIKYEGNNIVVGAFGSDGQFGSSDVGYIPYRGDRKTVVFPYSTDIYKTTYSCASTNKDVCYIGLRANGTTNELVFVKLALNDTSTQWKEYTNGTVITDSLVLIGEVNPNKSIVSTYSVGLAQEELINSKTMQLLGEIQLTGATDALRQEEIKKWSTALGVDVLFERVAILTAFIDKLFANDIKFSKSLFYGQNLNTTIENSVFKIQNGTLTANGANLHGGKINNAVLNSNTIKGGSIEDVTEITMSVLEAKTTLPSPTPTSYAIGMQKIWWLESALYSHLSSGGVNKYLSLPSGSVFNGVGVSNYICYSQVGTPVEVKASQSFSTFNSNTSTYQIPFTGTANISFTSIKYKYENVYDSGGYWEFLDETQMTSSSRIYSRSLTDSPSDNEEDYEITSISQLSNGTWVAWKRFYKYHADWDTREVETYLPCSLQRKRGSGAWETLRTSNQESSFNVSVQANDYLQIKIPPKPSNAIGSSPSASGSWKVNVVFNATDGTGVKLLKSGGIWEHIKSNQWYNYDFTLGTKTRSNTADKYQPSDAFFSISGVDSNVVYPITSGSAGYTSYTINTNKTVVTLGGSSPITLTKGAMHDNNYTATITFAAQQGNIKIGTLMPLSGSPNIGGSGSGQRFGNLFCTGVSCVSPNPNQATYSITADKVFGAVFN